MGDMARRLMWVTVIAACVTAPAFAVNFQPISGITVTTAADDLWPAANLIQGPGAGFDANAPYDRLPQPNADGLWVTAAPGGFPSDYIEETGMPVFDIDLGQDVDLSEISVWGYSDTNSNGVSEFSLRFATAAEGPGGYGSSITYNPHFFPAVASIPRQSFLFGQPNLEINRDTGAMIIRSPETVMVTARYIEFTAVDNYYVAPGNGTGGPPGLPGGDRAGLGEIAFDTDAELQPMLGYSITSPAGTLDPGNWTPIAGNYDAPPSGDGSVDDDDTWTALTHPDSRTDLSEAELVGGNGALLTPGSTTDLGAPWIKSPVEDASMDLLFADGTRVSIGATYVGNNDTPFALADLNFDGVVNTADWPIYRDGYRTDLSALSQAEAYHMGDLNGDGVNDVTDYGIFKTEFDAANGAGAFAAMVASVPEPATWVLLAISGLALSLRRLRPSLILLVAVALCVALGAGLASAELPSLVSSWALDSDGSDSVGGNSGTPTDVVFGQPGANANTGTSAQFNGASSTIDVPYSSDLNPASFTVTLWANANATGAGHHSPITSRDDFEGGVSTHGYIIYNAPSGNWEFWTGDGDPGWAVLGDGAVTPSAWTHLAIAFDATTNTKSFYVDGVLANSSTTQGYSVNGTVDSENLHIGSGNDLGDQFYFDGLIDDVAVFEGNLNPSEIANVMDNSVANFELLRLSLNVDTETGSMTLENDLNLSFDIEIDQYEILSEAGTLRASGWDSMQDQNLPGLPGGDGSGNGWEELGSPNSAFLGEAYLQDSSVLGQGTSVDLGQAYNGSMDARDLSFTYRTPGGAVIEGIVNYAGDGGGNPLGDVNLDGEVNGLDVDPFVDVLLNGPFQTEADMNVDGVVNGLDVDPFVAAVVGGGVQAVPEPSTLALVALAGLAMVLRISKGGRLMKRFSIMSVVAAGLLVALIGATAQAGSTNDRAYLFGDDTGVAAQNENATAGQKIGSGAGGVTFDTKSVASDPADIDAQNLSPTGTAGPTYVGVGQGPFQRTAADGDPNPPTAGDLGAEFSGSGEYLRGARLGLPETAAGSLGNGLGNPNDYTGIANRGYQLWVYPTSNTAAQSVVMDTDQHGVRISADGNWSMRYPGGTDVDSSTPVVTDQWSHVMLVRPFGAAGGSRLYVNGNVVAANGGGYTGDDNASLVLGSNTGRAADGSFTGGTEEFFSGVLDNLEMFVLGTSTGENPEDFGTFNAETDNAFIAGALAGLPAGDVNMNGVLEPVADVDAFVAGWLNVNNVNGIQVGDIGSRTAGDLNFDGITDLSDAFLLHEALSAAGGGLNFAALTAGVPEPSTLILLSLAAMIGLAWRKR